MPTLMAPNPMAETAGPSRPSVRCSMARFSEEDRGGAAFITAAHPSRNPEQPPGGSSEPMPGVVTRPVGFRRRRSGGARRRTCRAHLLERLPDALVVRGLLHRPEELLERRVVEHDRRGVEVAHLDQLAHQRAEETHHPEHPLPGDPDLRWPADHGEHPGDELSLGDGARAPEAYGRWS